MKPVSVHPRTKRKILRRSLSRAVCYYNIGDPTSFIYESRPTKAMAGEKNEER